MNTEMKEKILEILKEELESSGDDWVVGHKEALDRIAELSTVKAHAEVYKSSNEELTALNTQLMIDISALRNQLATWQGITRWECKCGGIDIEGQIENENLRAERERLKELLCIALDYLKPHYCMDLAPLHQIRDIAREKLKEAERE